MIAGAVTYDCKNSFLHHFQQLDCLSLQGATIGSFGIGKGFMCNGANLAYKKSLFQELNGFKEMTPSQAEMMYSYCKSDSAVSDAVHYVKSKATLSQQNL
jgi:hypothetical protein